MNSSRIVSTVCIINTNSSSDHDKVFGGYVHISSGVNMAGSAIIGKDLDRNRNKRNK